MGEHVIDLTVIGAVVFDSDGVVTVTARVHAAAWEHVFDAFLARPPGAVRYPRRLPAARGRPPAARRHPDLPGRARDHRPPEGSPDDEPCAPTVHGLGLAEDRSSLEQVDTDGGGGRARPGGRGRRGGRGRVVGELSEQEVRGRGELEVRGRVLPLRR